MYKNNDLGVINFRFVSFSGLRFLGGFKIKDLEIGFTM
jgi:hypothetical protein